MVLQPGEVRASAWAEHVSGGKHKVHMAMMAAIFLVVIGNYVWENYFKNGGKEPTYEVIDVDGRI